MQLLLPASEGALGESPCICLACRSDCSADRRDMMHTYWSSECGLQRRDTAHTSRATRGTRSAHCCKLLLLLILQNPHAGHASSCTPHPFGGTANADSGELQCKSREVTCSSQQPRSLLKFGPSLARNFPAESSALNTKACRTTSTPMCCQKVVKQHCQVVPVEYAIVSALLSSLIPYVRTR
jgi:hypothetical protein